MCGICGFCGFEDRHLLKKMARSIEHRGPDQNGFLSDKNVSLANQRLKIIDLSEKGRQPIFNEDKAVAIVFNGEIYNYLELRKDLEAKGLIGSSSKVMDCSYCSSTGRKNYGTKDAECIYCSGSGRIKEKTYPVIYRIREESKPAVSSVFNAIYEINMLSRPSDTT